jgi:hypothetical protein
MFRKEGGDVSEAALANGGIGGRKIIPTNSEVKLAERLRRNGERLGFEVGFVKSSPGKRRRTNGDFVGG